MTEAHGYVRIRDYGHAVNGDWCTCGEPVDDCFWHLVIFPAMHAWKEMQLNEAFARYFNEA